jgi:hypothetical protein
MQRLPAGASALARRLTELANVVLGVLENWAFLRAPPTTAARPADQLRRDQPDSEADGGARLGLTLATLQVSASHPRARNQNEWNH